MINPGVVTLASLNNIEYLQFPYRFCVEDNIGEAIHIHYKDIRLDLSTKELRELSTALMQTVDDIVNIDGFHSEDFDPVFLVAFSSYLPRLKRVEHKEIFLEDILCDTFDEDGKPCLRNIKHSRVFKALCGLTTENDEHVVQFNHLKVATAEKMTNQERLMYDLEQVKKFGYPKGNDLITLFNDENVIRDGQHRAACLYYLYGNIKVPVRNLIFSELDDGIRETCNDDWKNFERELYETAKKAEVVSSLFFDIGDGFKAEQTLCCINNIFEDKVRRVRFALDKIKNIRALRFDPIEGRFCKAKILSVKSDNDNFKLTSVCCKNNPDGFDLFYTTDPQYYGAVEGNISFVEVEFELEIVNEFEVQCAVYGLNEKCDWYANTLVEKDSAIERMNSDIAYLNEQNVMKSALIDDLNGKCDWYANTLVEKDSAIERMNNELYSVYHSHSWKLTTPLRKLMKILRRIK